MDPNGSARIGTLWPFAEYRKCFSGCTLSFSKKERCSQHKLYAKGMSISNVACIENLFNPAINACAYAHGGGVCCVTYAVHVGDRLVLGVQVVLHVEEA